jgi:hypothetical protein
MAKDINKIKIPFESKEFFEDFLRIVKEKLLTNEKEINTLKEEIGSLKKLIKK